MELCRRDVGEATWRHNGMELWRLATGVETWTHGALETRYGYNDVEVMKT